ncbi:MAG TPA: Gfo/Idh/MocA family oxidoreductase, partial [Candidatus Limnocylindrales bacterium]|nr:Gfo/Idh/MocA family oxidoreductase [Candidatus Limnocylindrales bacterium]
MTPTRFAIVGGGWRAEFFLRVAAALPERFAVSGLYTRRVARREAIGRQFGVAVPASLDALLGTAPAFVVVATPWAVTPVLLGELSERGMPVLAETPPAPDLDGLRSLRSLATTGRIQVAEQYRYQPLHAARLVVAASGRLGTISQARVSAAHGYHGVDLMRRYLGLDREPLAITAHRFISPIVAGPDRAGPPIDERIVDSERVIAFLDAGDRLGIHDFSEDQYFSWIRPAEVELRGERGALDDRRVRWLVDYRTPVVVDLMRHDAGQDGNLEGFQHVGFTLGDTWVYRNPFVPARLSDDEIAVATCLARMGEWIEGGPDV